MALDWKNSFPITMRELLVASRKSRTYWDRVIIGGFALILAMGVIFLSGTILMVKTSSYLYSTTHWLMLIYCFVAGAHTTCDCISWEKREGTLGLLYLSNMSSFEILMGKLTHATVQTLFGLMVCFPLLALPILMGGVTLGDLVRTVLAGLNLLFFSSAIGLLSSVIYREKQHVSLLATLLLCALVICPWLYLVWNRANLNTMDQRVILMLIFNIGTTFHDPADLRIPSEIFWAALSITHLSSWALLGMATALFPRCFQEKSIAQNVTHGWKYLFRYGSPGARAKHREQVLAKNPFAWLASRNLWLRWQSLVLIVGPLVGLGLLFIFTQGHAMYRLEGFMMALIVSSFLLKVWIAGSAAEPLAKARDGGTLEWLLSTPLDEQMMIRGQLKATVRQFGWAIAGWYIALLVALWFYYPHGLGSGPAVICMLLGLFLVHDCYTLTLLGMWKAITSKQTRTATPDALSRGVILPHLIAFFIVVFVLPAPPFLSAVIWFFICGLVNSLWNLHIKEQFGTRLRELAQNSRG